VLFAEVGEATVGPLSVPTPEPASFDPAAAVIALAAAITLLRLHIGIVPVLGAAALAGAVLRFAL
jgi:chromate transporter